MTLAVKPLSSTVSPTVVTPAQLKRYRAASNMQATTVLLVQDRMTYAKACVDELMAGDADRSTAIRLAWQLTQPGELTPYFREAAFRVDVLAGESRFAPALVEAAGAYEVAGGAVCVIDFEDSPYNAIVLDYRGGQEAIRFPRMGDPFEWFVRRTVAVTPMEGPDPLFAVMSRRPYERTWEVAADLPLSSALARACEFGRAHNLVYHTA